MTPRVPLRATIVLATLLLALATWACSDSKAAGDDGNGDTTAPGDAIPADTIEAPDTPGYSDATAPDGTGEPDGSAPFPDEPALLDQAPTGEATCSVTLGATELDTGMYGGGSPISLPDAGGFLVVWGRYDFLNNDEMGVFSTTVGIDGTMGPPGQVVASPESGPSGCLAASVGDDVVLVWKETIAGAEVLSLAQIDETGAMVLEPRELSLSGGEPYWGLYDLVPTADGVAILWSSPDGLWLSFVDLDGTPLGDTVLLTSSDVWHANAVATDGGLVVTWSTYRTGKGYEVFAVATDATGATAGDPLRISQEASETRSTTGGNLVPYGDGVLVAMAETLEQGDTTLGEPDGPWDSPDDGNMRSVIRLVTLSADATTIGAPLLVQAGEAHVAQTDPVLSLVGDDVVLTWSTGTWIYVCAGCKADNGLRFVLLDGETLAPLSAPVDIPPLGVNGLVRPEVARSGDTWLLMFHRDFHALSLAGIALVTCEGSAIE